MGFFMEPNAQPQAWYEQAMSSAAPTGAETLEGVLARYLYVNDEESFAVALVRVPGAGEIKAVGALGGLTEGERVRLVGYGRLNPRFGPEFRVEASHPILPATAEGIESYLASGKVKGIGRRLARRLVDHFGADTLRVIEEAPERLREVEGIGAGRRRELRAAFAEHRGQRDALVFLQGHGLRPALAARVWRALGDDTVRRVREDPFRLVGEVSGIGFTTADRIAAALGLDPDDPRRATAAVLHAVAAAGDDGHVYLPRGALLAKAGELLGDPVDLEPTVAALLADGRLEEDRGLYLPLARSEEIEAAERLRSLLGAAVAPLEPDLDGFEAESGLRLADAQRAAVAAAVAAPVFVLTGGPGTGKTTIVQALLHALRAAEGKVLLAAPTGRAARRMAEATGEEARTLHRLLEYTPVEDAFQRDEATPLEATAVVVDEASMVDQRLFVALLRAVQPGTRLLLVGDADQLPSVGAGNVLGDLLASGAVPARRLTEIFRQAQGSRIVTNAHRILGGELPVAPPAGSESDFYLVEARDAEQAASLVERVVAERIPAAFGFDPLDEVQVLTPMHRGRCGAQQLNERLQARLNGEGVVVHVGRGLRAGDKVMQIRNDYEREVFNGDVGRVVTKADDAVVVRFDERVVSYGADALDRLVLAYACTVHKSQGSEYPAVVLPLVGEHWVMLQRNLLYTAVTRGRRLVVVVAQPRALARAVANGDAWQRFTALARRLTA